MTAFRLVDLEEPKVAEVLRQMERFQPIGHAILNKTGVIQVGGKFKLLRGVCSPVEVAIGPKTRYTLVHWNGKRFSTFPLNDLAPTLKKNSQCLIFFMEVFWFTSYNVRGYRAWADKNQRYKLKAFHSGRSISGRGEESKAWRFKNAIYRSFVRFYDENNSQDSPWFSLEIRMYDKNIQGIVFSFFVRTFWFNVSKRLKLTRAVFERREWIWTKQKGLQEEEFSAVNDHSWISYTTMNK